MLAALSSPCACGCGWTVVAMNEASKGLGAFPSRFVSQRRLVRVGGWIKKGDGKNKGRRASV